MDADTAESRQHGTARLEMDSDACRHMLLPPVWLANFAAINKQNLKGYASASRQRPWLAEQVPYRVTLSRYLIALPYHIVVGANVVDVDDNVPTDADADFVHFAKLVPPSHA
jgi:hypothetical protein